MLKIPTKATLKKYGLTYDDWARLSGQSWVLDSGVSNYRYTRVGGSCAVCGNLPKSGILHIDHEHVKGWKKMPPSERKKYVRGLLCYTCNRFHLSRGMDKNKALNISRYLEDYESRKSGQET